MLCCLRVISFVLKQKCFWFREHSKRYFCFWPSSDRDLSGMSHWTDRSVRSVNINLSLGRECACERTRARCIVNAPRGADEASYSLRRDPALSMTMMKGRDPSSDQIIDLWWRWSRAKANPGRTYFTRNNQRQLGTLAPHVRRKQWTRFPLKVCHFIVACFSCKSAHERNKEPSSFWTLTSFSLIRRRVYKSKSHLSEEHPNSNCCVAVVTFFCSAKRVYETCQIWLRFGWFLSHWTVSETSLVMNVESLMTKKRCVCGYPRCFYYGCPHPAPRAGWVRVRVLMSVVSIRSFLGIID